jgi:transcriptional regulator with XRE-family HTH domain
MKATSFSELFERAKTRDRYWVERAMLDFTEEIVARMEQLGVSKSELANRLGKTPPFVTKLLRGSNNFTLETMVKVARQLKSEVRVHLQPEGTMSEWIDVLKKEPPEPATTAFVDWKSPTFKLVEFSSIDQTHEPVPTAA